MYTKFLCRKIVHTSKHSNGKCIFSNLLALILNKFSFEHIQTFGLIGLLAVNIARVYIDQYNSAAGTAFLVTLILLIIIICRSSLRQSSIFRTIEIIICLILTIFYVVGSFYVIKACWYWLFDNFRVGPFIGTLIASVSRKTVEAQFSLFYAYTISSQQYNEMTQL